MNIDIFGHKAVRRAEYFKEQIDKIKKEPSVAYRSIERNLAAIEAYTSTPLFGPRYTQIWNDGVYQMRVLLAIAEKAVRIERIAKIQLDIAWAEKESIRVAKGIAHPWDITRQWDMPHEKHISYLKDLKELLEAAKYGQITWLPEFPEYRHPTDKPLTSTQIADAEKELAKRKWK